MKFLIRAIGWERFSEEFEQRARRSSAPKAASRCRSIPTRRRSRRRPTGRARRRRRSPRRRRAPGARACAARASCRTSKPTLRVLDDDFLRWQATNVRPQKQAGYALVTATVPLGDFSGAADARRRRPGRSLRRRHRARDGRAESRRSAGCRRATSPALYARLAAAGLGLAGAGTIADVTSCPGAESCRLAVTQSRGLGALLERTSARASRSSSPLAPDLRHQDQRLPERLRPASHRRHRLPGQRAQGRRQAPCRSTS